MQLLFATLLPYLVRKPFDGFTVITVTSGSTITVILWVNNQVITWINLNLYVIAASYNLLALYKIRKTRKFYLLRKFLRT